MKNILLMLPLMLFMTGCQSMAKPPQYALTLKNGTTNAIKDAGIRFEAYRFDWGNFSPGRSKSDRMVPNPIPLNATVFWKSDDGKPHEKVVEVLKSLPKDFSEGDIILTILGDDSVTVTNKPFLKLSK